MGKSTQNRSRLTYSVRIDPELIKLLKHVAIDENRSIGELLEEGIGAVLKKRKIIDRTAFTQKPAKAGYDGPDIDDDQFDIPEFLREHAD
ncbi:MAG TPA: hypothetical protein VHO84_14980 [Syntrophorhabdaceae bacterium]|nr:hypothetical protein [Syntrophorhabdaceae bacterium]